MKLSIIAFLTIVFTASVFAQKETQILFKTDMGNIKIKLYNETPKHKENFIKLVNQKFYDGILFHRVIKDFMLQTGDPDSKTAAKNAVLGNGGPGYTLPPEFNSKFIHKRGALAAARLGDNMNPKKESSGSQFYIVQGKTFTEQELTNMEAGMAQQGKMQFYIEYINKPENIKLKNRVNSLNRARDQAGLNKIVVELDNAIGKDFKSATFSPEQKKIYATVGGAPHLDGTYTIFGEVIEGMDIVDKISLVQRDKNDRPLEDIKIISAEILK